MEEGPREKKKLKESRNAAELRTFFFPETRALITRSNRLVNVDAIEIFLSVIYSVL